MPRRLNFVHLDNELRIPRWTVTESGLDWKAQRTPLASAWRKQASPLRVSTRGLHLFTAAFIRSAQTG